MPAWHIAVAHYYVCVRIHMCLMYFTCRVTFHLLVCSGCDGFASFFLRPLGNQWNWVRENKSGWSLTEKPGFLTLTAGPGDITEASNNAGNILLQSANTDWTVDTKVVFSGAPGMPAQSAGIVAYQCDDNFVKFVYGAAAMGRGRAPMGGGAGSLQLIVLFL